MHKSSVCTRIWLCVYASNRVYQQLLHLCPLMFSFIDCESSDDLQASEVSSSRPTILANDVLGPLLLEALDGFLFIVNTEGKIEFVSENVSSFLNYAQVRFFVTFFYVLIAYFIICYCLSPLTETCLVLLFISLASCFCTAIISFCDCRFIAAEKAAS